MHRKGDQQESSARRENQRRIPLRLQSRRIQQVLLSALFTLFIGATDLSTAFAQSNDSATTAFRESVAIDVDSSIKRRLETVNQHIAAEQWDDAIRFLVEIRDAERDGLIKVQPERYVSAERHVADIVTSLPKPALVVWRERVDGQARLWFESAVKSGDIDRLQRIITQTPSSSFQSLALNALGNAHWQNGDAAAARSAWTKLLTTFGSDQTDGDNQTVSQPQVMVRLALCDMALGCQRSAHQRVTDIKNQFPTATGTIAGQTGLLSEIADQLIAGWSGDSNDLTDFAYESLRGEVWSHPFLPLPQLNRPENTLHPQISTARPTVFPTVWNEKLLINDPQSVYALSAATGKPAWSKTAVISKTNVVLPRLPLNGDPAFETSIDSAGRLFCRMGSPVTIRAERELAALRTEIVCLNMASGQGRELWRAADSDLGINFAYQGTPVCDGERVYCAAGFFNGSSEVFVVCLNATTGTEVWRQRACTLLRTKDATHNEVSNATVTVSEQLVVLATNQGAVVAFDKRTGTRHWVATYPSSTTGPTVQANVAAIRGDRVFVAPSDANLVLALNATSGQREIATPIPDTPKYLLGIAGQHLIVSGRSVWGIDTETGQIAWGTPRHSAEDFGYGRGVIRDGCIYWPRRGAIEFLSVENGRPLRRPLNLRMLGLSGGNLTLSQQHLLIAGPTTLTLLGRKPMSAPVMAEDWR